METIEISIKGPGNSRKSVLAMRIAQFLEGLNLDVDTHLIVPDHNHIKRRQLINGDLHGCARVKMLEETVDA